MEKKKSKFKKTSLIEMICGWIFVGLIAVGSCFIIDNPNISLYIGIVAVLDASVAFGFAIKQMIQLRKYGNITEKLTKKGALVGFITSTILAWVGIFIALAFFLLWYNAGGDEEFKNLCSILAISGGALTGLSAISYTIISTIAFAKSK